MGLRAILAGLVVCTAACSSSGSGHSGSKAPTDSAAAPSGAGASGAPAADREPGFGVTAGSVPPRAKRGEVVTASFNARPGSTCQLTVAGANESQQPVLPPAVADPSGQLSWTWRLSSGLKPGKATAWVACSGGAVGQAHMTIS
jgi:hypothetical protein